MKKKDILTRLQALNFDAAEYWVTAGSAMVLYGIREETGDIDIGCTSVLADQLEAGGFPTEYLPDGRRRIVVDSDVEIFENWLFDTVQLLDGYPVMSLQGLIEMKQLLGREKDLRDLRLIQTYLSITQI